MDTLLRKLMRQAHGGDNLAKEKLAATRCRYAIHRFEWGLKCKDCNADISEVMLKNDPGILPAWQRSQSYT